MKYHLIVYWKDGDIKTETYPNEEIIVIRMHHFFLNMQDIIKIELIPVPV